MARPKAAEKRDRQINVALTLREFDLIKRRADAVGARLVDYARAAILRRRIGVEAVAAVTDRVALEQLKRIGANLNQAVRRCHTFGHVLPPDLDSLLRDIRSAIAKASD